MADRIKIECAGWYNDSCDDGPGIRSVLFLQGCSRNCKGCHNAGIKEHGKGTLVPIEELMLFIESHCGNKKITISGGEPLEQANSLEILIHRLKGKGYNVCVYTGWEIERVPENILRLVDYIKTGSFVIDLKNPDIQYVGSSNQHMFSIDNGNIRELDLAV
ncbi:MAG: 4Fe-4S single cluster domain-containing protein [Lachnospiraceae bacterium]|jgi:anaerobic ribonucleoside-triphosphate reductase activating protein|nr:4Fe-4S single cluster domain-containing protein [Lachnospiraceae bacterium]